MLNSAPFAKEALTNEEDKTSAKDGMEITLSTKDHQRPPRTISLVQNGEEINGFSDLHITPKLNTNMLLKWHRAGFEMLTDSLAGVFIRETFDTPSRTTTRQGPEVAWYERAAIGIRA